MARGEGETDTVTRAGVGFSKKADSRDNGVEAARLALEEAGVDSADLVILFTTGKHDPANLRDGVRSVVGPTAKIVGGYSMGIITRNHLSYDGFETGLAVVKSDSARIDTYIEKGLVGNEANVGVALGNQIKARNYVGEPNVLLMYDSVKAKTEEGTSLNLATPLINGIESSLGTMSRVAGVGMTDGMQWNPTMQFFDDQLNRHTAIATVFHGGIRMDTTIMHGCAPASDYHTITKAEHNVIYEIDGKPAVDVVAEMLGPNSDRTWEDYPLFVTLGLNNGDKFGDFQETDYANRLVMAVDKEKRALVMFEPDLKAGHEVQLMRRSIDFGYIGTRAEDLLAKLGNRKPLFALYIDCLARASAYCGTDGEEAAEVQRTIGSKMPLLGIYSGVEIAKVGKLTQALDWTGVLCVFSE
jgi:hypothetical protein